MRFECDVNELLKAIDVVYPIIDKKPIEAIFSHIVLRVRDRELIICAANSDSWIESKIFIDKGKDGIATIPGEILYNSINNFKKGRLLVESDGFKVKMISDRGKFSCMGADPDEFPMMPESEMEAQFSINEHILSRMINKTKFAISDQMIRPQLCGTNWMVAGSKLAMIATDGFVVSYIRESIDDGVFDPSLPGEEEVKYNAIVSGKSSTDILKAIKSDGKNSSIITLSSNLVTIESGFTKLVARKTLMDYPELTFLFTGRDKSNMQVGRIRLMESLRRAKAFSDKISDKGVFKITEDNIHLSAKQNEIGAVSDEDIKVDYKGEEITIGISIGRAIEVFRTIDTDRISLNFDNPETGVVIRPIHATKNMNYVFMLMPMRLIEDEGLGV